MDLYLNDWSFSCSGKLNEQWKVISKFGHLVRDLKNKGVDKIVFPADYKNKNIGNIKWKECYNYTTELKDRGFSKDQCNELVSLMDTYIKKPFENEIKEEIIFSDTKSFDRYSHFLGNAYTMDLPVVSFVFNTEFRTDTISGFLKNNGQLSKNKVEEKNLYD